MLMSWTMFIAFVFSLALPVLGVVVLAMLLRRLRRVEDGRNGGSLPSAVLDSLDQVHVRLDALNDRMTRLESLLHADRLRGDTGTTLGLPETSGGPDDDGAGDGGRGAVDAG